MSLNKKFIITTKITYANMIGDYLVKKIVILMLY